jgi:hypothetical protein
MTAVFVAITGPVATFLLALLMRAKFMRAEKKTEQIHVLVNSRLEDMVKKVEAQDVREREQDEKIARLEGVIETLHEAKAEAVDAAVAVADGVKKVQGIQASQAEDEA